MTTHHPLGRTLTPSAAPADCYALFIDAVAAAQVARWAPEQPARVLVLSGPDDRSAEQLVQAGHEVVRVRRPGSTDQDEPVSPGSRARLHTVLADPGRPDFLADSCLDAVLADGPDLSQQLALESSVVELRRVLRPGGRLLLVVESLDSGMARLADQGRWAELADLPHADVVLLPADPSDPDGAITRCFWPEEVRGLLEGAGLEVDWVRPRTVLTPAIVERALRDGGRRALQELVSTELQLCAERDGEVGGRRLVASARRPA